MKIEMPTPSERQKEFFKADKKYVAYGGARGGGKSWAVRWKAMLLCMRYQGIKILIMRKTYEELRQNHIDPLRVMSKGIAQYNDTTKSLVFMNGSKVYFGYCSTSSDLLRYQGQEYDVIFLDEATQHSFDTFDVLKACIRGVNDFPKRFYLTCNPGGVGHAWAKRLFVDRIFYENEDESEYMPLIKATVYDNKALLESDPDYVKQLESYTGDRRRAWLEGDWDVYDGLFFREFDERHIVAPFEIPSWWMRYRVIDYGLDMLACLWIAVDEWGKAYVYDELCVPNMIISDAASAILSKRKESVICTYAPSDLWGRSQETGRSRAEIFAEHHLPLVKVTSKRIEGWYAVREWIKPMVDEEGNDGAMLKIFDCCTNLIKSMKEIQYDENTVEDCATEPHELTHAPDALRYWCVSRTLKAIQEDTRSYRQKDYEEYDDEDYLNEFLSYGG